MSQQRQPPVFEYEIGESPEEQAQAAAARNSVLDQELEALRVCSKALAPLNTDEASRVVEYLSRRFVINPPV